MGNECCRHRRQRSGCLEIPARRRPNHLDHSLLGSRAGFPGTTDYVATKAAIVGYSKGAARDLGRRNITVNVIQAGVMVTDMVANSEGKLPPGHLDLFAIRRLATVEEVAAGVVYLSGPNAGFITGFVLDISGGYLA